MKRHRTVVSTLALIVGLSVLAPAPALAGGPLLSGYGGPGAGAQAILGAALLNGPGGGAGSGAGSSGGSSGAGGLSASHGATPTAVARGSGSAADAHPSRGGGAARGPSGGGGSDRAPGAGRASKGASAAYLSSSRSSRAGDSPAVAESAEWFSGGDLALLALAAGALALTTFITVRLARAQHR